MDLVNWVLSDGFSNVHFYGIQGEYLALVMDLLGANLEELFRFCKCQFSLKTIVMLAEQLVRNHTTDSSNSNACSDY